MKKMKKRALLIAAMLTISMALTGCGSSGDNAADGTKPQNVNLSFASGGTSGTYYPIATAIAKVWNDNIEGMNVNVQSTGASNENINLIDKNEADVALVQNDVMKYAYDGTQVFEGNAKTNFNTLGTVYAEVCQIVVDPKANIQSIADLKGKRVSVGDVGSGTEANAQQILDAYGLTFDDLGEVQHLGFGDSAEQMKDGKIDAFFVTAGAPTTAIMELATTKGCDILPVDADKIEALKAEYPFYVDYTIPAGEYEGVDEDITTVAVKATIIVNSGMDEEIVYNMTKALFENTDDVAAAHAKGQELSLESATEGASVPFHPGAIRYYEEQGISLE